MKDGAGRLRRVHKAAHQWRSLMEERTMRVAAADPDREVLRPLPRRTPVDFAASSMVTAGAPMRLRSSAKASIFRAAFRLFRWLVALLGFGFAVLVDKVTGRDSLQRRAERLSKALEKLGGTFLKLGQQLSIRVDLLPEHYCHEFGRLLDRVEPFPTEKAIEIVEEQIGKPLSEAFAFFDPEPIGSASIACVYQARLTSGERVAVKVRRPNIERTFAADWRALGWLAGLAEILTIARKGQLSTVLRDLRAMIDEELDLRIEARNTELFDRRARQAGLQGVSTPKVCFELSTERILVTEFVSGLWLWEALAGIEQGSEAALELMNELGIKPKAVARRLYRASLFGIFDSHIFHADPHPANVVVRAGGEVVLIDFGSCGAFSDHQVRLMRQFHANKSNGDLGGMVQCVLALLEPLPPIDVDVLTARITEVLLRSVRAIDSPNAEWWERTSAGVWLSFMTVVRAFDIRVDIDVLRMIRSTLLYDTLALRLDPELDIYGEYQRYRKVVAKRSRQRMKNTLRKLASGNVDDRWFLRFEEGAKVFQRGFHRLERLLDSPTYRFAFLAGKTVFALGSLASWLGLGLLSALVSTLGVLGWRAPDEAQVAGQNTASGAFLDVINHAGFLGFLALTFLFTMRVILVRLKDPEI